MLVFGGLEGRCVVVVLRCAGGAVGRFLDVLSGFRRLREAGRGTGTSCAKRYLANNRHRGDLRAKQNTMRQPDKRCFERRLDASSGRECT